MKTNLANFLKLDHCITVSRAKAANRYKIALQKQNKKTVSAKNWLFLGEAGKKLFGVPIKTAGLPTLDKTFFPMGIKLTHLAFI